MAKTIKLPADLRDWKVTSFVGEDNGCEVYKVSRKIDKNTAQNAILRHAFVGKSNYTDEHAEYFTEEADFIESVKELDGVSNYLDVYVQDNQNKETCDLYIFTEELTSLEELMKTKTFAEDEVVDFGIQMSSLLETLEAKNIFHGNISPKNIFVTADGRYKIGGFTDFEGKIEDKSYIAPEVFRQENVDYTTDIYSVGIIMYAMCNGGKIPFENDSCDRDSACKERFSGKAVTAPSEGDEKLKSVIVIACQPDNANRWKNASNIKNALTSIKTEIGTSSPVPNPDVVVPESTDFDGNVFEEYDYDEFEDTEPTEPQDNFDDKDEVQTVEDAVLDNEFKGGEQLSIDGVLNQEEPLPVAENASVEAEDTAESDENDDEGGFEVVDVTDAVDEPENTELKTDDNTTEYEDISSFSSDSETDDNKNVVDDKKPEEYKNISSNSGENEVVPEVLPTVTSTDVFENYSAADHKNNLTSSDSVKDYGDFFDDEPSAVPAENKVEDTKTVDDKTSFDDNSFENDNKDEFGYENEDDNKENVKKKKNKFIIVLCAVVIAAALGFIGFCVYNGLSNSSTDNKTTTAETATSAEVTTQAPSTAMPTTVPATTEQVTTSSSYNNVVPVVGYGYSYGKKLLEQAGFTVEISDYEYSYDYPEGYIISQTPEGDTSASTGTVVKLVISSGQIQRETKAPATQAQQSSNSQNSSSGNANSQSSNSQSSSNTNTNNNGGFIFPNSDSSYLSNAQVSALSDNDLQLAINEIYARRGRIFKDASLNAYFNSQSWYEGKYTAEEFEKNVKFNTYEQKNLQLLINERRSRK
ncbi:YARHG domain-containing protein [Ruminococcus bromii]|jgi:PASTA domain./protein kinase domain|uniref:YARHG domain-containing protein n=2 Tax=Ruminococcus bromii TaxID=40518 RepID=UPI003AB59AC0